jgi:predicted N-acetyltransferase YhbS
MQPTDMTAILTIQLECYAPMMVESEPVICARLAACADTAWVAEDQDGVCAYLVAYRSELGKITPLDSSFAHSTPANSLYLHDLAVATRSAGHKVGTRLVDLAYEKAVAEKLLYSCLVSVQGTEKFWQKLGFTIWENLTVAQAEALKTYQPPAYYMSKKLL